MGEAMKPKNGNGKRRAQKIPEILSADEQTRLLAQLADDSPSSVRGKAILRILLDTGLRAAELINLRLRDLDLVTGRLWVRQGKGRKDRGLWFNGRTRAALEAWFAVKLGSSGIHLSSSAPVFTSLDGWKPICGRWLRRWIERIGKEAGVEKHCHLHLFRHTFCTDLLRSQKNLRLVQKAAGHQDIKTTTIYTHIVDEELEEAMKNFRNGG